MARDYKHRPKRRPPPLKERFSHALSFLTGLCLGLFVAVIVYFKASSAGIEVHNPLLGETDKMAAPGRDASRPAPEKPAGPELEFYRVLPGKEVNIPERASPAAAPARPDRPAEPALFVLQVGSFREYAAADQIKARLALAGVRADIQRVVINGQEVRHRVRVGPYTNAKELQQARQRLAAHDLDFVLLKLEREDT